MPAHFADLSHHQHAVDLAAYKAAGHDRIVLKATEGTGFLDPQFAARWALAGRLGLNRVAYHYLRNATAGAGQWAWFARCVRAAGPARPGDWLCLDSEDTATPGRAAACSREFTAAAVAAGFPDGLVYTGRWYANPNGITPAVFPPGWRRLWLSDYTPGQPDTAAELPTGWTRGQVAARQFTDKATVPGVGTPCDYNRVLNDWLTTVEMADDMAIFDTRAEFDAAVRKAVGDVLHDQPGGDGLIRRAFTGTVQNGWHSEDWATIGLPAQLKPISSAVSALAGQVAALAGRVAALADDEAKTAAAVSGAEARILAAVRTVIVDPQVDNDDPAAVVAAFRDALTRGTVETGPKA